MKKKTNNCVLANIYHCCVHKTGSQWIKAILSDRRVFQSSGLTVYTYQERLPGGFDSRKLHERFFFESFPSRTIISPLYIHYDCYRSMPKAVKHKTFFVMRDPRDIIVSWYFSVKCSHSLMGEIGRIRKLLNDVSLTEGLIYAVDYLNNIGLFSTLNSWINSAEEDRNIEIFRFEDMVGDDQYETFRKLFYHIDVNMRKSEFRKLLNDYSFRKLSGRKRGVEDNSSHYRKGIIGDWRNYYNCDVIENFMMVTGDLLGSLNYEDRS